MLIIKIQHELRDGRLRSSILMDIPNFNSVEEVTEMARDKENWQFEANALQKKSRTDVNLVYVENNITEPNRSRANTTSTTHSYNLRSRNCSKQVH